MIKVFFRSIKLKSKLLILAGIPLLGMFIFSTSVIVRNYNLQKDAGYFYDLVEVVLVAGELVHELQEERDIAILYIASKGQRLASQLAGQYKITDEKIRKFQSHWEASKHGHYSPNFREQVDAALSELSSLSARRSQLMNLNTGIDEVMPYYRDLVEDILGFDTEFVLHSPNGEISRAASTFNAFMEVKEYASRERAELSFAFNNDGFRPGMYMKLFNIVNAEDTYTVQFEHLATDEQREYFSTKMQHPVLHDLKAMREVAIEYAERGKFGVDPMQWFKFASERHDLLGDIETKLASDIYTLTSGLEQEATKMFLASLAALLIMFCITLYLGWMITVSIVVPINKAVEITGAIASGNLHSVPISNSKHSDEIGMLLQGLRGMQKKLTEVIRSTKQATAVVKKGAEEIWASNSNLSERTDQQASNLQETTSSMEEMAGTVRQNADNAKQANQLARAARENAEKGGEIVGRAVYAMNKINDSSKKIADIISVIDEIAFQTNLLALNAAVEAARAGEQGRGFAVVATEVRNLAGRSATAAKEIKGLIEDSVSKVDEGSKMVNSSGQMLTEIVSSVKKVSDIIAEIAAAGQEQSTGIDQVSLAVSQMDELTQQNATMVQESANASETMGNQANSLRNILSFFKMDDDVDMGKNNASFSDQSSAVTKSQRSSGLKSPTQPSASKISKKAASGSSDDWESF